MSNWKFEISEVGDQLRFDYYCPDAMMTKEDGFTFCVSKDVKSWSITMLARLAEWAKDVLADTNPDSTFMANAELLNQYVKHTNERNYFAMKASIEGYKEYIKNNK